MAKKKTQTWLDRGLFQGGFLALVTSQEEYNQVLKDLACADATELYVPNGWPACTHTFTSTHGSISCVVAIDMVRFAAEDPIDAAALLVHEAVHVWQENEKAAGQMGCFGSEGEAYAIQNISTRLMGEYARRING